MPSIDSKISCLVSPAQEAELKTRFGKAISLIPGKSERWLMTGFQGDYSLYFRGDNSEPAAFVTVDVFGGEDPESFDKLTGAICSAFEDVLGIAPDHVYVRYLACRQWGWNGNTF